MHMGVSITLSRDLEVIEIPSGNRSTLPAGTPVRITQSLGSSYTITAGQYGYMYRVDARDADALGLATDSAESAEQKPFSDGLVWDELKTVYDPEIPVNIVDLGLVYECNISKNDDATRTVDIKMTLTAPGCGMGEVLVQDVRDKVQIVPTVARANVELVFDPPWNQTMMSDEARLQTGMM